MVSLAAVEARPSSVPTVTEPNGRTAASCAAGANAVEITLGASSVSAIGAACCAIIRPARQQRRRRSGLRLKQPLRVVQPSQRRAMADADDGRVRELTAQALVQRPFGRLIER